MRTPSPGTIRRSQVAEKSLGAGCSWQAYDRGMTESKQESTGQDAPLGLQPLPGAIELLDGGAAGYCSNGVCHIPAPKER